MGIQAGTIGKIFLPCDTIQERSAGPHNKRTAQILIEKRCELVLGTMKITGEKKFGQITQSVLKMKRNYQQTQQNGLLVSFLIRRETKPIYLTIYIF